MFRGTGTALITPFDGELNVDLKALKKLVRFQIEKKVNFLVVLGTTGEAPVIDEDERKKIIETVVNEAAGKIPIVIGTGSNDTRKVVKLNKIAEDLNANGVLIVNPYYNKGTQSSLVDHYKYISEKTPLPIIIYNVPSRTAMNMQPETILKIHSVCPNVVAVKEACGDISQIAKLIAMKPDSLSVLSGNDDQTLPIMSLGGVGVISVFSNPFPSQMAELTTSMLSRDLTKAIELNNKYLKMMNLLFVETSPMPVKFACSYLGLCMNTLRLPLKPITELSENLIKTEIERIK
ncbi:MAG: 4-hydroxy-tetrahydrodipicolinate synthase [Ignavibacteriaceae bacterium]|nr:4-hydroxy-tetrahydrodipicolinate synthase [Ignavibacteriaceae bacterium]